VNYYQFKTAAHWQERKNTMKSSSRLTNSVLPLLCATALLAFAASHYSAKAAQPPTLVNACFYGGAGDQRGTAIVITNGGVFVCGNVQPESQSASDTALVLRYNLPFTNAPAWSRTFDSGSLFYGITATAEGVYAGGWSYSLTYDPVGGKEDKAIVSKFAQDGSSGPGPNGSIWTAGSNGTNAPLGAFFSYSGLESFQASGSVNESGTDYIYAVGGGQPCSYGAELVAKYDTAGHLIAAATDSSVGITFGNCYIPSTGSSIARGVTFLNGSVYVGGGTGWQFEDPNGSRPVIWKHDSNLNLLARWRDTNDLGTFNAATASSNAIFAVGYTNIPNVAGSEGYLIVKYDESGNVLWRTTAGGSNSDVLSGVVMVGGRLFAIGYTRSQGAGGADAVLLEIDPANGNILSTTLYGGTQDDFANGVATDGTDLYIVGESRSFTAGGNGAGQNDVMLLHYSLNLISISMYAGLTISAPVGSTNQIQYVTNLTNTSWTTLTNLVLPSSPYIFIDYSSPGQRQRFYRDILQ
jgi:hypothetical protein